MVERLKNKEGAVKRASVQVTERVFLRQKELRHNLLGQIELAGVQEKETLRQWKKIIASITHPRSVVLTLVNVHVHPIVMLIYWYT